VHRASTGTAMKRRGAVLIVEDDPDLREAYGQILLDGGWSIVPAADGIEALRALEDGHRPCVVLLDLRMPQMDGWELSKRIHRHREWRSVPIVVLAAHYRVADEAQRLGAREWLLKPVGADRLLEVVEEACRPTAVG
jgi:CheY-like chemotaxis protein